MRKANLKQLPRDKYFHSNPHHHLSQNIGVIQTSICFAHKKMGCVLENVVNVNEIKDKHAIGLSSTIMEIIF